MIVAGCKDQYSLKGYFKGDSQFIGGISLHTALLLSRFFGLKSGFNFDILNIYSSNKTLVLFSKRLGVLTQLVRYLVRV